MFQRYFLADHTHLAGVGSKSVSTRDQTLKVNVIDLTLWSCSIVLQFFFNHHIFFAFFFLAEPFCVLDYTTRVNITCYSRLCYMEEKVYYRCLRLL